MREDPYFFRNMRKKRFKNKKTYLWLALGFGMVFWGATEDAQAKAITAEQVVELTNEARSEEGLWKLERDPLLDSAALAKLKDMDLNHYFAHYSPDGSMPWDFITNAGYKYEYAGENLAIHYKSVEKQHQAWMDSPMHRKNILSANYTAIGVAVGKARIEGEDALVTVQMFARPLLWSAPANKVPEISKAADKGIVRAAETAPVKEIVLPRTFLDQANVLTRKMESLLFSLASSAATWKALALAIALLTMLDVALVAIKYRHGPPHAH